MNRWIERLAAWAKNPFGSPVAGRVTTPDARRGRRPNLEGLERREVLSTTAVHPFMTIPAAIDTTAQSTTVQFQLTPGNFTAARGKSTILLGLNTRPAPGSAANTDVSWLDGPAGAQLAEGGSTGDPMLVSVPVPTATADRYTVRITNTGELGGGFGLDGFLAGDVNGDQKVDASDLDAVVAAYGSHSGDARYNAAADINQDGRVGRLDYNYTVQNLGAQASYIQTLLPAAPPVVAAVTPTASTPQVVLPLTTASVQPIATLPSSTPGYVLVPASSVTPSAWSSQPLANYPTVQYGSTVPSGPLVTTAPTASYGAAASYPAQSTPAYSYSYTPNGTTPVYLTQVN